MSPSNVKTLADELKGLGKRVSLLERVVYTFTGGVSVTAFFIITGIIKVGG